MKEGVALYISRIAGWMRRLSVKLEAALAAVSLVAVTLAIVLIVTGGGDDQQAADLNRESPGRTTNRAVASYEGPGPEVDGQRGVASRSEIVSRYTIPSDKVPVRISIPGIGVDAPIAIMGLDRDRLPDVPLNGWEVAWYDFSALPGTRSNAVMAGHVRWRGQLAAFANLSQLRQGDTITIVTMDGQRLVYTVSETREVDTNDKGALSVLGETDQEMLTLVTCAGEWVRGREGRFGGDYDRRLIVRASAAETIPFPVLPWGF